MIGWVVVSNIFYFHPYLGKIPILTNIFQLGWNHQLVGEFEKSIHTTSPLSMVLQYGESVFLMEGPYFNNILIGEMQFTHN